MDLIPWLGWWFFTAMMALKVLRSLELFDETRGTIIFLCIVSFLFGPAALVASIIIWALSGGIHMIVPKFVSDWLNEELK